MMPDFEYHGQLLLVWLYERSESGRVEYQDVHEFAKDYDISDDGLRALTQHVETRRLVQGLYTLGGHIQAIITAAGIARAQDLQRTTAPVSHRARALRVAMLLWLHQQESAGQRPSSWNKAPESAFARLPGGTPTTDELKREAVYLAERGLVQAGTAWGVSNWLHPKLTADGRDCISEYGGNVSEYLGGQHRPAGDTYQFTDINGNITVGSAHVTQTNTQANTEGLDTSAILHFAGLVCQIGPTLGLDPEAQADLTEQAGQLHTEASSPAPERGALRRLLDGVVAGLTTAAQTAGRDVALAASHEAVQALTAGTGH